MLIINYILVCHFIADFICQNDSMALNKSRSLLWLGIHSVVYAAVMGIMLCLMSVGSLKYVLLQGILHFMIDFCSSRATTYLWQKNQRHYFFVVIGLDQLIHTICLLTLLNI
jgi:ABC-type amino acid transport system permease subunit